MTAYSVFDYGKFINDSVRMNAYVRALRQAVKTDSVVLDIGTGTGIFALLACQFGARQVYAIEPAPVIQLAREMANDNHFGDRIRFINDLSTRITGLEPVDVIVSDLHGGLPLFQQHIPVIADARRRFLAVEGTLIPACETLWAAVAEAPESYGRVTSSWASNSFGLDMRAALRFATNTFSKERIRTEQLLAEPQCWATLDYAVIECPDVCGTLTCTIERPGTAHGLSIWFDAILARGIGFSNAPWAPEIPQYSSMFFPWSVPMRVDVGDKVGVILRAKLIGEDYIWSWETSVFGQGNLGDVRASFRQSTFLANPLSLDEMHKSSANHVPTIGADGEVDRLVLELMDGGTTLNEISHLVMDRFPGRFDTWYGALSHVAELSRRYSR